TSWSSRSDYPDASDREMGTPGVTDLDTRDPIDSIGSLSMRELGGYRLVERIGEGGMGEVWLAEHGMLGRCAAIKLLHPKFSVEPQIVARFFNEARAATSINDPGIVQIFDFGHDRDGTAFLVMELLHGETLHARLRKQRPI